MQKLLILSLLLLTQASAVAAANVIFLTTGTTNLVVAKDQKIKILHNNLIFKQAAIQLNEKTYTRAYNNILEADAEIVGPITLTLDSEGYPRWMAYEVIATQSEAVVISGDFPNFVQLEENVLYKSRTNFRKNGNGFNFQWYKTVNGQQTLITYIDEQFTGLLSVDVYPTSYLPRVYHGPGTLVRSDSNSGWDSNSWAVIIFEKIPYNPPGVQSATVQIQKSPDLSHWTDLTNISVQTNQPNTYLRFKVEK